MCLYFFESFERQLYVGEQTAFFFGRADVALGTLDGVLPLRGECVPPTLGVEAGAHFRKGAISGQGGADTEFFVPFAP